MTLELPLNGENSFAVKVFDKFGHEQPIGTSKIVITKTLATIGANYIDVAKFKELKKLGDAALLNDDIDQLRQILFELLAIKISSDTGDGMFDIANIVKG